MWVRRPLWQIDRVRVCMLGPLQIRDEKGDEITRQVLGVGALRPAEQRTFTLEVEVLTPAEPAAVATRSSNSKEGLPTGV